MDWFLQKQSEIFWKCINFTPIDYLQFNMQNDQRMQNFQAITFRCSWACKIFKSALVYIITLRHEVAMNERSIWLALTKLHWVLMLIKNYKNLVESGYILEKKAQHLLREKRTHFFIFMGKREYFFSFSRGFFSCYFYVGTWNT